MEKWGSLIYLYLFMGRAVGNDDKLAGDVSGNYFAASLALPPFGHELWS